MNPRDTFAPYSLSRGAPSPLGYFSISSCVRTNVEAHGVPRYLCVTAGRTETGDGSSVSLPLALLWRRGWDSNPRALSDKRFSRPPRYDHFDTSPYRIRVTQVVLYHARFASVNPFSKISYPASPGQRPSCQNATALAAATFNESTPCDIGMHTV